MRNSYTPPLAEVFVEIPKGFWVDDWFDDCLARISEKEGRKILKAILAYRKRIAEIECWGAFRRRDLLTTSRGISVLTGIDLPDVVETLRQQTEQGIWSFADAREFEPLASYYLWPRKFQPESEVDG